MISAGIIENPVWQNSLPYWNCMQMFHFLFIFNHLYCVAVHHGEPVIEESSFGSVLKCHASQEKSKLVHMASPDRLWQLL